MCASGAKLGFKGCCSTLSTGAPLPHPLVVVPGTLTPHCESLIALKYERIYVQIFDMSLDT
jgi:hypothetical protein